jgi:hypothetical protein
MKKIAPITVLSVLTTVIFSSQAQAATFTEMGDAGETLSTAQVIPSKETMLQSISGTLSGDADLFKIFLNGDPFSATTVGGADFPTQLSLFDSEGMGVYFNERTSSSVEQSTLPANNPFTPTQSGIYYLAISVLDLDPINEAGDDIFPDLADFSVDVPLDTILTGVFEPTAAGAMSPLSGFDGAILDEGGSYTIALTGVTGVPRDEKDIPEPASALGLLAIGALGLVSLQKNKSKKIC